MDLTERILKEQQSFREILVTYINGIYSNPRVLNICCGPITEEPTLIDYFGFNLELFSLDCDPQFEQISKQYNRNSFHLCDLRYLERIVEGKFDIILGRNVPLNPNHHSIETDPFIIEEDPWSNIFKKLGGYMKPNSILFLTLLRQDEFYRGHKILSDLGYDIIVKEKNKIRVYSDLIGVAGSDTKDHYVIIAKK